LDGRILLDLPPTAVPQLHRLRVDFSQIEHVLISHLHADHIFGLPFFLLEYCVRLERDNPIVIAGPRGIENITLELCELAWPQMQKTGFEPRLPIEFFEISEEGEYTAGTFTFRAVPMVHFDLEAFGFRFTYKGRTIGYSGDTGECDQLYRLLEDVDIAILELTHPRASDDPGHMDPPAFERIAKWLVEQETTILATPDPIPGVEICEDGKTYWV
jgi:ribonuclease BN (tRNA processing enzyme)